MSDPRYTDPRYDPPPLQEPTRPTKRSTELESSNAMWGWIAGAVVLALVLVFIFGRMNSAACKRNCIVPADKFLKITVCSRVLLKFSNLFFLFCRSDPMFSPAKIKNQPA
jgi:hypothetical protein